MRRGDAYRFNDPYLYLSDPALIAFTMTFGTYQDLGGAPAGAVSLLSTEIHHENLRVPPDRTVREGWLNDDTYRIFPRHSRMPNMVKGATRAMMASCRPAATQVTEPASHYGVATRRAGHPLRPPRERAHRNAGN